MLDPAAVTLARAILEAGSKGVDEVNQEIRDLEVSLTSLGTAYKQGHLKITEYAHESERLHGQIDRLKTALSTAETAVSPPPDIATAWGVGQTSIPFDLLDQVAADREAGRLANALESSVGKTILVESERGENAFRSGVNRALASAGVPAQELDDLTTRVAEKLSASVHTDIKDRALKTGSTYAEAKANWLEEAAESTSNSENPSRSSGMSTIRSEVVSDQPFFDRMMVAGFSSSIERDEIPARQLDEQKNTNKKLDGLTRAVMERNKQGDVARFARGRT